MPAMKSHADEEQESPIPHDDDDHNHIMATRSMPSWVATGREAGRAGRRSSRPWTTAPKKMNTSAVMARKTRLLPGTIVVGRDQGQRELLDGEGTTR